MEISSGFPHHMEKQRPPEMILLLHKFITVKHPGHHGWLAALATQITDAVAPLIPQILQHVRCTRQTLWCLGESKTFRVKPYRYHVVRFKHQQTRTIQSWTDECLV